MKKALIGMCLALVLVSSACGDGDVGNRAEPSPSSTASTSTSPTPAPTPCVLEDGDTDPVKVKSEQPIALMTDLRPNADGCPRVVFEFQDHLPGYDVRYVEPPISDCGSGEEAPINEWDADAYLDVRLVPAATADQMDENARPTYTGPRDIAVDGAVLKHVKKTCDFEADVTWVIALDEERPFKVDTFEDPPRLVIDISGS